MAITWKKPFCNYIPNCTRKQMEKKTSDNAIK